MLRLISYNFLPSKHLLVFKTSWKRLQDMSWRSLQNLFSVTIFLSFQTSSRRLEDVLQKHLEDVLKTSSKRLGRRKIVTLKTSWRRLKDMFSRRLKDMFSRRLKDMFSRLFQDMSSRRLQDVYWEYLYLKNLNLYLINLYLTYLYPTNQGQSKMH